MTIRADLKLVQYTAKQINSSLMKQVALAQGLSGEDMEAWRMPLERVHCHDSSMGGIAWNDVQAIQLFNQMMGENIPVPEVASEGYNQHYHTSEYDGGLMLGTRGPHDHRSGDPNYGGYAFATWHPGTALPQQPWAI